MVSAKFLRQHDFEEPVSWGMTIRKGGKKQLSTIENLDEEEDEANKKFSSCDKSMKRRSTTFKL